MVEEILHQNIKLAIIIRSNYYNEGISFFTPNNFSQQLGYMNRPKGYLIEPHVHKLVERTVFLTQEVLYIKSGKVKVNFYSDEQKYLQSSEVCTGDVILLAAGGHGFEFLEDTEMIEIKQGPYAGDEDKIRFQPNSQ